MRLKLTPSAVWLLQYIIRSILRKSRGAWAHINLTEIAERERAPTRRALQTALNALERAGETVGVVIRCTFDRGAPRLIIASTAWLQYDQEPLFFKEDRKTRRHLRPRCRSRDLACPKIAIQAPNKTGFELKKSPQNFTNRQAGSKLNHCADSAPIPFTRLKSSSSFNGFSQKTSGRKRLENKAAAITDRLRPKFCDRKGRTPAQKAFLQSLANRCYDNCKVRWNRNAIFAFTLQSLLDGCHENAIEAAYEQALCFAHGVAQDEILEGKRHPSELAPPSLLIWKARQILAGDGLTPQERKARLRARFQTEHEAIAAQSQKAAEWFATKRGISTRPSQAVPAHAGTVDSGL